MMRVGKPAAAVGTTDLVVRKEVVCNIIIMLYRNEEGKGT